MNDLEDAVTRALTTITPPMPEPRHDARKMEALARTRRTRRRTVFAGVVALALIGGGAASQLVDRSGHPVPAASTPHQEVATGRLVPYLSAADLRDSSLFVRWPGSAVPRFSRSTILDRRDWEAMQLPGARPVIAVLRYLSPRHARAGEASGGHAADPRQLVWFVVVPDVRVCPVGIQVTPAASGPCPRGFWYAVVDATTGRSSFFGGGAFRN